MRPSPFSRACDECRRRKVRCDAANPCSNCRIAQLTCTFRVAPRKRGRKPRLDRRPSCEPCSSPQATSLPPMELDLELETERHISPQVGASPLLSSASPSSSSYLGPRRPQDRPRQQQLATPTVGIDIGIGSPFSGTAAAVTTSSYSGVPGHAVHSDQEQPGSSSGTAPATTLLSHPSDASMIRRNLLLEVSGILRDASDSCSGPSPASLDIEADLDAVLDVMVRIMHKCIDLFAQYFFPNTPIAHIPSLRIAVSNFASGLPLVLPAETAPSPGDEVFWMRSFTLITALCAFITSVVPDMTVPHSNSLTWPFYHASRAMARLYEELDLESPVSSSYTSRIWQSAALQNVTGKNSVAWHVSGEVTIMALRTRLYDEETVSGSGSTLESQLLRANFWLIYLSDRTATAFEGRPSVMSDVLSHGLLTLLEQGPCNEPLLDTSNPLNGRSLEELLMRGFHLKTRLWASAADFMHHLTFLMSPKQRQQRREQQQQQTITTTTMAPMQNLLETPDWARLVNLHQTFLGVLDDLPNCLRSPNGVISNRAAGDDPIGTYQAQSFWPLRNNIFSVYHCMRLVILHECVLQGIPEILGLENKVESLVLRKLEVVQDFLLEMQLAPFMCLRVQGEAAIQRIRRVGCILLEMVNHAVNDTLHKRAISQFNQILDVLTSLDSKATATELGAGVLPAVMNNVEQ